MEFGKVIEKMGMTADEHRKNVAYLADLETIRINQFQVFQIHLQASGTLSTSLVTLKSEPLDNGWIYVITHISGVAFTTGTPQIKLGATINETDHVFESATVTNAEDSVEYVGQIFLKEGDKIFGKFENAAQASTVHVFVNGYKVRK